MIATFRPEIVYIVRTYCAVPENDVSRIFAHFFFCQMIYVTSTKCNQKIIIIIIYSIPTFKGLKY